MERHRTPSQIHSCMDFARPARHSRLPGPQPCAHSLQIAHAASAREPACRFSFFLFLFFLSFFSFFFFFLIGFDGSGRAPCRRHRAAGGAAADRARLQRRPGVLPAGNSGHFSRAAGLDPVCACGCRVDAANRDLLRWLRWELILVSHCKPYYFDHPGWQGAAGAGHRRRHSQPRARCVFIPWASETKRLACTWLGFRV